jgi:hypothetical protein
MTPQFTAAAPPAMFMATFKDIGVKQLVADLGV